MHGVQKIEQSIEEQLAKEKERTKKLKAYQHMMKLIFDKRLKNNLDLELLDYTYQVLCANPDISTLWNIRREVLLHQKNTNGSIFYNDLVTKEFNLTEICLKSNPKSYSTWFQRRWIMKETNFIRVEDELKICSKYLTYDERNFHCWDYRRYLLDNNSSNSNNSSIINLEQELKFTTEKIISNFSNYSSWHLRSTLLPKLSNDYLFNELQLIKNAAFTDPNDQSVWLYHRWLLISNLPNENPELIYLYLVDDRKEKSDEKIWITVFNVSIGNPSVELNKIHNFNNLPIKTTNISSSSSSSWSNPWNSLRSKIWIFKSYDDVVIEQQQLYKNSYKFPLYFDSETKPKSIKFMEILQNELEWIKELNDLEDENNKWIISTLILLYRLMDFNKYHIEIEACLNKIIKLDPKRLNYYLDLYSKYIIEWKFIELFSKGVQVEGNGSDDDDIIDLSGLNLTSVYYLERLCTFKNINLSLNNLTQCKPIGALVLCESLNLSCNNIKSSDTIVSTLNKLENLKDINVNGNPFVQNDKDWDNDKLFKKS